MAIERWLVKVICMIALFVIMCTFVLLPIKVSTAVAKQGKRGLLIISVLSCFGGGVFFGAYLTHMNPEVRLVLQTSLLDPNGITYPLPELLTGLGFFIILFMERLVMMCRDKSEAEHTEKDKKKFGVTEKDEMHCDVVLTGAQHAHYVYPPVIMDMHLNKKEHNHDTHHSGHMGMQARPGYEDLVLPGTCCTPKRPEPDALSITSMTSKVAVNVGNEGAQTRSNIFMIAMSLDCVFEGLALGLMHDSQNVIDLFVAIISHEFIMCFCIGLELVKYHKTKNVVAGGVAYALTETVGIVIGMCILEVGAISADPITIDIVTGVLQALSAGTFIYCAFLGILRENLDNDHGILKSAMVMLGFALMAGFAAFPQQTDSRYQFPEANTTALFTAMSATTRTP